MATRPLSIYIKQERVNFAPSEIADAQPNAPPVAPNVDEVLDECRSCRTLTGEFTSYNEKAGRILAACLRLRRLLNAQPELIERVRKEACRDLKRCLSGSKLDLICLRMCIETSSEDERKKSSKFAKVVKVAWDEGVEPQDAVEWIKSFRAAKAAKRRAEKSCPARFPIRFLVGAFPSLASATKEGNGWPGDKRVSDVLAAAAQRCEQLLREAAPVADLTNTAWTT